MKRLVIFASFAALAVAQQTISRSMPNGDLYEMSSGRQELAGGVMHLSGHVVIETDTITIHADEVDFDTKLGEFTARGNVTVKLKK